MSPLERKEGNMLVSSSRIVPVTVEIWNDNR
jgi:hypothetical protein